MTNLLGGPGRRCSCRSLVLALLCSSLAKAAGTERVTADLGLVELRLIAPAGADVSWDARKPLDLSWRSYEGGSVCVFCAHYKGTYVLLSDVIDWEARKRDKTTWIVTIGDDPGPGPGPDPKPPPPATFADWVRGEVAKVPATGRNLAAAIGQAYSAIADRCGVDLFTPQDIREATRVAIRSAVPDEHKAAWRPFFERLADELFKWDGQSSRRWQDYQATWKQIAEGMK